MCHRRTPDLAQTEGADVGIRFYSVSDHVIRSITGIVERINILLAMIQRQTIIRSWCHSNDDQLEVLYAGLIQM